MQLKGVVVKVTGKNKSCAIWKICATFEFWEIYLMGMS